MTVSVSESRHLPAGHAGRMADLERGPKIFDGRSIKWIEILAEAGFVLNETTEEEKRTTIRVALTERGRSALERDRRGVDPYLVMT